MQKHILFLLFIFLFASCKTAERQKPKDFKTLALQDFYGEEWKLTQFLQGSGGDQVIIQPNKEKNYTFIFKNSTQFAGTGLCNSYSGSFVPESTRTYKYFNEIRIADFSKTGKNCGTRNKEDDFFQVLENANYYRLNWMDTNYRLTIYEMYSEGNFKALTFTKDTI